MSKIIDITDKLNFEEKPVIKVKNIKLQINNDAITMLKVIALLDKENSNGIEANDILTAYELLFDKENQEKIQALKLSFNDFSTLVVETANTIINDGEAAEGEAQTPATT